MPKPFSFSLKVVATETLSNTASTATPARIARSCKRNAQLLVGLQQLRIDFVQALGPVLFRLRRRIINDVLVVDRGIVYVGPRRLGHGLPVTVGLQAPLEQPLRLLLLGGNQADDVFTQAAGDGIGFDVGDEPPLIFLIRKGLDRIGGIAHQMYS